MLFAILCRQPLAESEPRCRLQPRLAHQPGSWPRTQVCCVPDFGRLWPMAGTLRCQFTSGFVLTCLNSWSGWRQSCPRALLPHPTAHPQQLRPFLPLSSDSLPQWTFSFLLCAVSPLPTLAPETGPWGWDDCSSGGLC